MQKQTCSFVPVSDILSAPHQDFSKKGKQAVDELMDNCPWSFGDSNRTLICVKDFCSHLPQKISTELKLALPEGTEYIDLEN